MKSMKEKVVFAKEYEIRNRYYGIYMHIHMKNRDLIVDMGRKIVSIRLGINQNIIADMQN